METPENNRARQDELLEALVELVSALKRSAKHDIFIPRTVDEAILRSARRHLSERKRRRFTWALGLRWAPAAAIVVLLLAILPQVLRKAERAKTASYAQSDLNHDGRVDILDAFALARELKAGGHVGGQFDINGDGVVDERDVAALAARAVSLAKGGHW